jgi:VanZ family protein
MPVNRRIITTMPLLLFTLLIFVLSHMERPLGDAMVFEWQDKILHFSAFFAYGIAALVAIAGNIHGIRLKTLCIAALLWSSCYGALDEFHQSFVPGRSVEIADWIADTAGAAAALLAARRIRNLLN